MVFKPFGALARQSFAKHFTNGYAQSAVAAAQSSYASSTTFPLVRIGHQAAPAKAQAGFGGGAHAGGRADYSSSSQRVQDSLSPYYTTLTQNHDDDGQWRQFQYPKRIMWSPATPQQQEKDGVTTSEGPPLAAPLKPRAASMSGVREFSTSAVAEQEARQEKGAEDAVIQMTADVRPGAQTDIVNTVEVDTTPAVEAVEAAEAASEQAAGLSAVVETQAVDEAATYIAQNPRSDSEATLNESHQTLDESINDYLQLFEESKNRAQFDQVLEGFSHLITSSTKPTTEIFNYVFHAISQMPGFGIARVSRLLDVKAAMIDLDVPLSSYSYSILIYALCDWAGRVNIFWQRENEFRNRFKVEVSPGFITAKKAWSEAETRSRALLSVIQTSEQTTLPYDKYTVAECVKLSMELLEEAFKNGKPDMPYITYNALVRTCADADRMEDVVAVLEKMETINMAPDTTTIQSMIGCFGRSNDMNSAIDCFSSAIAGADKGSNTDLSDLNTALLRAYFQSGNIDQGLQFASKLMEKSANSTDVCVKVAHLYLEMKDFSSALKWTQGFSPDDTRQPMVRNLYIAMVSQAADREEKAACLKAFNYLKPNFDDRLETSVKGAIIAMLIRQGDISEAVDFYSSVVWPIHDENSMHRYKQALFKMIMPHLIGRQDVDQGMEDFCRVLVATEFKTAESVSDITFQSFVEPAIEKLETNSLLSQKQALTLMRLYEIKRETMSVSIARKLLTPFQGVPVESLTLSDFHLVVLPQSVVATDDNALPEDIEKLTRMLELAQQYQLPLWNFPAQMIKDLPLQPLQNLDIELAEWEKRNWSLLPARRSGVQEQENWSMSFDGSPGLVQDRMVAQYHWSHEERSHLPVLDANKLFDDYDPYPTVNGKFSAQASSLLDGLTPVTMASQNFMKPRRNTYESVDRYNSLLKLLHERVIQPTVVARALASISRFEDVPAETRIKDLQYAFDNALNKLPFFKEYRKSRYAWYLMHDAMIAACLTLNYMEGAARYHRDMLLFGASPSANTYGLYIVNLKGSHETFDEASEALAIFERAKSEGVVPTSFLYNALIGKLSKARRIDDCLFYFSEMRALGIQPTSITYGTIVNALCRVSDERFAEELFAEMEAMPNYKPRPAPYNSIIQYFVGTKRDRLKALQYYEQMLNLNIRPTAFTFKLLIEAYATCDPPQIEQAKEVFEDMRLLKIHPGPIHYAAIIHARGCVLGDMQGAQDEFDEWLATGQVDGERGGLTSNRENIQTCFQALCEAMVANHQIDDAVRLIEDMKRRRLPLTPYIANSLIHGHAVEGQIEKAKAVYKSLSSAYGNKREPSTYEAMAKAHIGAGDHESAVEVVNEMASRSYPAPVMARVLDLLRGGGTYDVQYVH